MTSTMMSSLSARALLSLSEPYFSSLFYCSYLSSVFCYVIVRSEVFHDFCFLSDIVFLFCLIFVRILFGARFGGCFNVSQFLDRAICSSWMELMSELLCVCILLINDVQISDSDSVSVHNNEFDLEC